MLLGCVHLLIIRICFIQLRLFCRYLGFQPGLERRLLCKQRSFVVSGIGHFHQTLDGELTNVPFNESVPLVELLLLSLLE